MRNSAAFSVWNPTTNQWDEGDVAPQGPQGDEGPKGTAGYSPINFAEFTAEFGRGDDGVGTQVSVDLVPVTATTINPCCVSDSPGQVRFVKPGAFVAVASLGWDSGYNGSINAGQPLPGAVTLYSPASGTIARGNIPDGQRDASCFATHNSNQLNNILQVWIFKQNAQFTTVRVRLAVWTVV